MCPKGAEGEQSLCEDAEGFKRAFCSHSASFFPSALLVCFCKLSRTLILPSLQGKVSCDRIQATKPLMCNMGGCFKYHSWSGATTYDSTS